MESTNRNCHYLFPFLRYSSHALIVLLAFLWTSCTEPNASAENQINSDVEASVDLLDTILSSGKLIAYTDNSVTSYFIYKGQPMGYEYEILQRFAEHLGVELELIIEPDIPTIFKNLNAYHGHIGAANLTVTQLRKHSIDFSNPLLNTKQVLVQRLPDGYYKLTRDQLNNALIRDPLQLEGQTVHVQAGSSFETRLENLNDEIGGGITIDAIHQEPSQLFEDVADGTIDYTIVDQNVGRINKLFFRNVDIKTAVSFNQNIGWAIPKNQTRLLDTLNSWLDNNRNSTTFAVIYNKYFKHVSAQEKRLKSDYTTSTTGKISPYDGLIKSYARKINWDWRLLAALIYRESRFNSDARSWTGATGLMQILPTTASDYGVDSVSLYLPDQNIKAGTAYLQWLKSYWAEEGLDSNNVIKFSLASYNVGLGHVKDAQRLADKYDKDRLIWDEHVAEMLKKKSKPTYFNDEVSKHGYCRGDEPYNYVKSILSRYKHYQNFSI